jgi:hypothetical protein
MKPLGILKGTMTAVGVIDESGFHAGSPDTIASIGTGIRTGKGRMSLGIPSSTFTATTLVRLQCRDDDDDTTSGWRDVTNPVTNNNYFTVAGDYPFNFLSKAFVRLAIKTGDFTTSDSISCKVQGEV